MTTKKRTILWLLTLGLALPGWSVAGEVTVAVAANFLAPMKAIARRFEAQSGHGVTLVSGSSGKLYAQIRQGAPFDLFLSADREKPRSLAASGEIVADTRFTYAVGRLVLWSPGKSLPDNPLDDLAGDSYRRLAVANPELAPYGRAAVEVLQSLGIARSASARLVRGENIAQTWQFVATGNADAGLVALSQIRQRSPDAATWALVPDRLHGPILQDAVLLRAGADSAAARALLTFLRSETALEVIRQFGYGRPDG